MKSFEVVSHQDVDAHLGCAAISSYLLVSQPAGDGQTHIAARKLNCRCAMTLLIPLRQCATTTILRVLTKLSVKPRCRVSALATYLRMCASMKVITICLLLHSQT